MQVTYSITLVHTFRLYRLDGEEIGPEGVERFCFDLEVDPEDVSQM